MNRVFNIGFHGGWGARLFMLGAAMIFARRHERRLRIFWDHQFACPWSYFTSTPIELISADEWELMKLNDPACWWEVGMEMWNDEVGASPHPNYTIGATEIPPVLGIDEQDAVNELRGRVTFDRVHTIARCTGLERRLRDAVGVHVRRTDHAEPIEYSPTSLFVERMRRYRDGHPFFVCSDDPVEKVYLEELFPGGFGSDLRIGRDRPSTLMHDLAEAVLLGQCKRVLGSYRSSFSRFAAYWGGAPLEILSTK